MNGRRSSRLAFGNNFSGPYKRHYYCQTPVLGLGLGVDFTFAWENHKNHNHNNPHLNFMKGTVLGAKEQV